MEFIQTEYRMLDKDYFEWLKGLVGAQDNMPFYKYSNLLEFMQIIPYVPTNSFDESRYEDGMLLRHYYKCDEHDFLDYTGHVSDYHYRSRFYEEHTHVNCTILEMFISLAKKIDDQYLNNKTDRTYIWFWMMLDNMGLLKFTNDVFINIASDEQIKDDIYAMTHDFMYYNIDDFGNYYPFPFNISGTYNCLYEALNKWISDNFDVLYNINPEKYEKDLMEVYKL